jgi:hypothetical protein
VIQGPLGEVMSGLRKIQGGDFAVTPSRQAIDDMALGLGASRKHKQLEAKV